MKKKMAFNQEFLISGLSELAPSALAVIKAFAGTQKDNYGFLVYMSFRKLLWINLEFLLISKKTEIEKRKQKNKLPYLDIFLKRRFYKVIFDDIIVKWFKEMLISRNLLKIELPRVHFWTSSFCKFLAA